MAAVCSLAFSVWQSVPDANVQDIHWIMISEVVIAAVLLLLILGLLIAGLVALSYVKRLMSIIDEVKGKADPIVAKGTAFFDDLSPKVRHITANVEHISFIAKTKVDEVGETITQINRTVNDVNARTRVQTAKVDGIVSDALATTKQVSESLQNGIKAPIRQVAALIAGLKAGMQTLAERSPWKPSRPTAGISTRPYDYQPGEPFDR